VPAKLGYVLSRRAFQKFKKHLDYSEYGGAPLLGVRGVCIICHGGSNANAIKNAIRVAAEFAEGQVNEKIEDHLAATAIGRNQSGRGVGARGRSPASTQSANS
jgi:glycerol-3-phosphate acyltransferase PlsX